MELSELQALWQQQDKKLSENTRINKEILKQILIAKPEKRINREKINVGIQLIAPVVILFAVLIPNVEYRSSVDFYIGCLMFGVFYILTYYWTIRYFMFLRKVDFSNSVTSIKKQIKRLEGYHLKIKKFAFVLSPLCIIGIFLMGKFPFFSLPLVLILFVFAVSVFYTFKYRVFEYHRKLDKEIAEIEKLEEGE